MIWLDAQFQPQVNRHTQYTTLKNIQQILEDNIPQNHIKNTTILLGQGNYRTGIQQNFASMQVELVSPEDRKLTAKDVIQSWNQALPELNNILRMTIEQPKSGPPGDDLQITLLQPENSDKNLEHAHDSLVQYLKNIPGISMVDSTLAPNINTQNFTINLNAMNQGIAPHDLVQSLYQALTGSYVDTVFTPLYPIDVRVAFDHQKHNNPLSLQQTPLNIHGQSYYMSDIAKTNSYHTRIARNHYHMMLGTKITAQVDPNITNAYQVMDHLKKRILPELKTQYGIKTETTVRSDDAQKTISDLKYGVICALLCIYFILCWVTESFYLPIVIMSIIPCALIGVILGHWFMHIPLTLLSIFGMFGLIGIVINDSIILILAMQKQPYKTHRALFYACKQRFRPIVLTSLTTCAGLLPLLFETSIQAQFLIPMATTIVFGIMTSGILILYVIPCLVMSVHALSQRTLK